MVLGLITEEEGDWWDVENVREGHLTFKAQHLPANTLIVKEGGCIDFLLLLFGDSSSCTSLSRYMCSFQWWSHALINSLIITPHTLNFSFLKIFFSQKKKKRKKEISLLTFPSRHFLSRTGSTMHRGVMGAGRLNGTDRGFLSHQQTDQRQSRKVLFTGLLHSPPSPFFLTLGGFLVIPRPRTTPLGRVSLPDGESFFCCLSTSARGGAGDQWPPPTTSQSTKQAACNAREWEWGRGFIRMGSRRCALLIFH